MNKMSNDISIGFIGCGKVTKAFITGLLKNKYISRDKIVASSPLQDDIEWAKSQLVKCVECNIDVIKASKIVILAVRPEVIFDVITEIRGHVTHEQIFISVAAGVKLKDLCEMFGNMKICRIMLNLQIQSNVGTLAFCRGPNVSDSDAGLVTGMLKVLGHCSELPESNFDVFTALAGSGPAYIYGVIEALAEGAVINGMARKTAIEVATHMVQGAGIHAWNNIDKYHPCQLREAVCTPDGSSIRGVRALENAGYRAAFIAAIDEAVKRNMELGKK